MSEDSPSTSQSMEVYPGVIAAPRIAHGTSVLAGTRIPVRFIVGQLAGGESIESVALAYGLTEAQVRTALAYTADRLAAETIYAVYE